MKKAALLSTLVVLVQLDSGAITSAPQPSQTLSVSDPIYDAGYNGTAHAAVGEPFLIQVNGGFFRKTAAYPRGETVADGTFLFVDIKLFNNSDRPLQVPRFTLRDSRGTTYLTAIRARRSNKAILAGEWLNPGVGQDGYLIFDVPSLSGSDSLPLQYKLLIDNSPRSIDINVDSKEGK